MYNDELKVLGLILLIIGLPVVAFTGCVSSDNKPQGSAPAQPEQTSIPFGQPKTVDNWEIRILGYTPDATYAVEQENFLNSKPSAGGVWSMINVAAKNVGKEKASFDPSWFHLEGASGQVYDVSFFPPICPNNFPSDAAFPGATLSGNIGLDVAKQDANSVKLYCQNGYGGDKIYFDLPGQGKSARTTYNVGGSSAGPSTSSSTTVGSTKTLYTKDGKTLVSKEEMEEYIKAGGAERSDYEEVQVPADFR